ncbi:MAG: hypothetical protein HY074_11880 [Deltaproteobacteria bacterium]|nr:hypothetical protein [Deltaproteobacteria bacterium]
MIRIAAVLAMLGLSLAAQAAAVPELERFLDREVGRLDDAVAGSVSASEQPAASEEAWFLRNFFLRVKPRVTLAIPGLSKLEIIPEAEILWQRALPEGWAVYKPR